MTLKELIRVVNNEVESNSPIFPPNDPLSFTHYLIMKAYVHTQM